MRNVACPVLRQDSDLLVFRHPLAGVQLVKGGIEEGETPTAAALRELQEEAGISANPIAPAIAASDIQPHERWWLVPVTAGPLPTTWDHHCADAGGHLFHFFWHPIAQPLADADPRFERARVAILASL